MIKETKRKIIGICFSLMLVTVTAATVVYTMMPDRNTFDAQVIVQVTKEEKSNEDKEYNDLVERLSTLDSFYNTVHEMANTQILAEDKKVWGKIEITSGKCQAVLDFMNTNKDTLIQALGEKDYNKVYEGISKWKEHDYSVSARIHNIVWQKLNGTLGRAIED